MGRNSETVSAIYQAFQRGDIPGILARLTDDVRWDHWDDNHGQKAGVPWMVRRTGREEVTRFFSVAGELQFREFDVRGLMEGNNQVAAEVVVEAHVPSLGKTFRDEEIHLWTFDDHGQVTGFRHYIDTAKHVALLAK